jgi:hypothetical protein
MKLVPCPDCKKLISRHLPKCLNCGRPITPSDLPPPIEENRLPIGTIILAAIIVLIVLMLAMNAPRGLTDQDRMRQLEKMEQTGRGMR